MSSRAHISTVVRGTVLARNTRRGVVVRHWHSKVCLCIVSMAIEILFSNEIRPARNEVPARAMCACLLYLVKQRPGIDADIKL